MHPSTSRSGGFARPTVVRQWFLMGVWDSAHRQHECGNIAVVSTLEINAFAVCFSPDSLVKVVVTFAHLARPYTPDTVFLLRCAAGRSHNKVHVQNVGFRTMPISVPGMPITRSGLIPIS